MFSVYAFYEFFFISNLEQLKEKIFTFVANTSIKGTILIASEGLNGTVAGTHKDIQNFSVFLLKEIETEKEFNKINYPLQFENCYKTEFISNTSKYGNIPFLKMKIKIKPEIVSMKTDNLVNNKALYVDALEWDTLTEHKDSMIIDTRNSFEYEIGTFENAINPQTDVFSEFPKWVEEKFTEEDKENKNILMFCTGGIRCEKATRFMIEKGFKKLYHLKGGVIRYFKKTKNVNKKWKGKCFVFDDRYAVNEITA